MLRAEEGPALAVGDLVTRRGHGLFSEQFAATSPHDQRFSHIGIITGRPDAWQVVHAIANDYTGVGGVTQEPLATFLSGNPNHAYFRLRFSPEQITSFVQSVTSFLERQVPFDVAFDLSDVSRVYCTELIWVAARQASGLDIAPHKTRRFNRWLLSVESITSGSPFVQQLD